MLTARLQTAAGGSDLQQRLAWAEEAVALAEGPGHEAARLEALRFRGAILVELGRVERAGEDIEAFARLAQRLGWPSARISAASRRGLLASLRGDWAGAEVHALEAARIGRESGDPGAELLLSAVMSVVHERAGDHDALARDLAGVERGMGAIPFLRARVAAGRALLGEVDAARRQLALLLPPAPGDDLLRGAMLAWSAEALHRLGDREHAAALRELLWPLRGRVLTAGGAIALGPADRYLALLDELLATTPVRPDPTATAAERDAYLVPLGDAWSIGFGRAHALLKQQKGIAYLWQLVSRPRQTIPALELVGAGALGHEGREATLDQRALAALRTRAGALREQLAEAEADHDPGRAERARDELEQLTAELRRSLGTGGKARLQANAGERARMAVAQALRRAFVAIAKVDPALADYLERAVRAGQLLSFDPPPEPRVRWHLSAGP